MNKKYFDEVAQFEQHLSQHYSEVLSHPLVQRLKGISFLATMDVLNRIKYRYSRYDHSLGVAFLAYYAACRLNLSDKEERTLIIAGLLHDIGHAPFSHAAEPFLRENLSRYHEGITTTSLSRFSDIISKSGVTFEEVKSIIMGTKKDTILHALFSGTISLDTLDGTNRTAFQLGLPILDPREIVDSIYRNGEEAYYFQYKKLPLIRKFAEFQDNLYKQRIYTKNILAAEAMLTRALELVFNSKDLVQQFKYMTDEEAFEKLNQSPCSRLLVEMIQERKLFKPLSEMDIFLSEEVGLKDYGAISKIRFDFKKRKEIETIVAERLAIPREFVIFHSSYVRQFKISRSVHQILPFPGEKDVPARLIFDLSKKSRDSGARIDIFFPPGFKECQFKLFDFEQSVS